MTIPLDQHSAIRRLNVDEHKTRIQYDLWEGYYVKQKQSYLRGQVRIIKQFLGIEITRGDLVKFYKQGTVRPVTKFIAAMMWGFEAPMGGRRANYGPYRVAKMFLDRRSAVAAIEAVDISDDKAIKNSYVSLDGVLKSCGPNFFTKHFYFLGKSVSGKNIRSLIFDDRVAAGLLKMYSANHALLDLVKIGAKRNEDAYIQYLDYPSAQAAFVKCRADQIEYFLFHLKTPSEAFGQKDSPQ